jgi:amidase
MMGADGGDPATRGSRKRAGTNMTKLLDRDGLREARIGVARNMAGTNPRILKVLEQCIEVLKHLGAVVVDPADVPNFDKFEKSEMEVLYYEFKADLNKYLGSVNGMVNIRSLEDVIEFNEENDHRVMPYFGQERMVTAQEKKSLRDKKYRDALAKNLRLTRKEGIDAALRKHKLDALIVPSGAPAWLIDLVNGDASNSDVESTSPAAVAGYPHITVPAGLIFGLPVGISFFASAWQEPTLIKFAYAFEQATQFRRQPRFLPTANLNP